MGEDDECPLQNEALCLPTVGCVNVALVSVTVTVSLAAHLESDGSRLTDVRWNGRPSMAGDMKQGTVLP